MWYNVSMLKAALTVALVLLFLPAIKVALLCILAALNYIPNIL